jgi:D-alanine transaminase
MPPLAHGPLLAVIRETLRRNRVANGMVYLQVTRGVAPRDHAFPPKGTPPGLVVMAKPVDFAALAQRAATGVAAHLVPEVRWSRRTIKTTALLPAVLAKQAAREAGAYEGWFVTPEGRVTEGASTNAWMVDATGTLVTHPADGDILHGVTRAGVLRVAHTLRIPVREVAFTVDDLTRAAEAFMSSATAVIMPVTSVSGIGIEGSHTIGEGRPGAVTQALRHAYFTSLERGADPG